VVCTSRYSWETFNRNAGLPQPDSTNKAEDRRCRDDKDDARDDDRNEKWGEDERDGWLNHEKVEDGKI